MAIDKLSDVLKQEAEGIMFPFRNKVKPVSNTTQEAYNSTTDGIMSITGKQYIGPDSVIQYGDSYQRQLKQIEKGMLPQFDQQQFPDVGEGKVEDRGFPKAQPMDTTSVQPDEPKFDPCPPGFKLINGVCQPVEQNRGGRDRPIFTGPEISKEGLIAGYTHVLNREAGSMDAGALNSRKMKEIEDMYGLGVAAKVGEINQKYRNRGVQLKAIDKSEYNRILSVYGQERIDKDYTLGKDGQYYRIIATSPTLGELLQDAAIAAGEILENTNMTNIVENTLSDGEDTDTPSEKDTSSIESQQSAGDGPVPFGELPQVQEFGQLVRDNFTAQLEIKAAIESLQQLVDSQERIVREKGQDNYDKEVFAKQQDLLEARNKKEETDKQIEDADLGDNIPRQDYNRNDTAQERRFKEKVEEKRIQNEVKKFQEKQRVRATKPDKARKGERLTLRL